MAKLLNCDSADGACAELAALVVGALEAVVEVLIPGVGLVAGGRRVGPVGRFLEFGLQVLEEYQLVDARGQLAVLIVGPCHGVLPARLDLSRQEHERDRTLVREREARINSAMRSAGL